MCVKEHLFNCNCDCKYILLLIRKNHCSVCKDYLNNGKHTKSLCIISERKIDHMPLESVAVCTGIILILLSFLKGNEVGLFDPVAVSKCMSPFHLLNQLTEFHGMQFVNSVGDHQTPYFITWCSLKLEVYRVRCR